MEDQIRQEVEGRTIRVTVEEDLYTPGGRLRANPIYSAFIRNGFLGKERVVKGRDVGEVERKVNDQLSKWNEQEIRARVRQTKDDAKAAAEAECEDLSERAQGLLRETREILEATLGVDDRINWNDLVDREQFPQFTFTDTKPSPPRRSHPPEPRKASLWEWLIPSMRRRREQADAHDRDEHRRRHERAQQQYESSQEAWSRRQDEARALHEQNREHFLAKQQLHNTKLQQFRESFEQGDSRAICEYLEQVFERSDYPEVLFLEHRASYEGSSRTVVIDVTLPSPEDIPDITEYRFIKSKLEARPVYLKKKEHEELYDTTLHRIVLRTLHEVFEAVYTEHVQACVVNGWVTSTNKATGNDDTSCILSVSTDRDTFESFNLARVDPSECFRSLKGLVAGPLAQLAPVQPILKLERADDRFIESQEVLAELNSHANLAEIPWQEFEHLVRDLFEKEFATDGTEVRVTQSSRDGGVDAIAFDPDPIRGGKFVVQAKRFTKTVPVSAVRDLYGTLINEGASRGILVTTAHYGRDARRFVTDKPLTLIDGNNLVHMLERHGHRVRIDIDEARAKKLADQ